MRPRWILIEWGFSNRSILRSHFKKFMNFFKRFHNLQLLIFYNSSLPWNLLYLQFCSVFLVKKIIYFFVVNLYVRAVKKMPFLFLGSSPCYYLFKCTRNNTPLFLIYSSCHRVCLSTTCLPVCENGAIIPLKNIFD